MKKLNIFILFLLLLIKNRCDQDNKYLTLKFKTNIDLNQIDEENFVDNTLEQNIYVEIDIGTPPQKIPMTIKTWQYPTFVFSSDAKNDINIKFNQNKSDTFQSNYYLADRTFKYDFSKSYLSNDIFKIKSTSSYYQFMLALEPCSGVKNISGEIGLSKANEKEKMSSFNPYSVYPTNARFIEQLLHNKLIDNKMFGIVYDSEYEGRLIFGKYLYQVDKNYEEKDIIISPNMDNRGIPDDNYEKWLMKFDLNCYNGKDNNNIYSESSYGFLEIEKGLIKGSNNFWNNFIKPYFERNLCKQNGTILIHYYCSKKEYFEDFPNIVFSNEGKYKFNLTKDDLFKKVGNIYIFLIVFDNLDLEEPIQYWRIGKPFFQKYALFLKEQKDNGYEIAYSLNKYAPYNDEEDGIGTQAIVIIVLSCILVILIAVIVIYYVYFCPKQRKKTATELIDDDFVYEPKEEKTKNKLINEDEAN